MRKYARYYAADNKPYKPDKSAVIKNVVDDSTIHTCVGFSRVPLFC